MATIAIGDVHGNREALDDLLARIRTTDARLFQSRRVVIEQA